MKGALRLAGAQISEQQNDDNVRTDFESCQNERTLHGVLQNEHACISRSTFYFLEQRMGNNDFQMVCSLTHTNSVVCKLLVFLRFLLHCCGR